MLPDAASVHAGMREQRLEQDGPGYTYAHTNIYMYPYMSMHVYVCIDNTSAVSAYPFAALLQIVAYANRYTLRQARTYTHSSMHTHT